MSNGMPRLIRVLNVGFLKCVFYICYQIGVKYRQIARRGLYSAFHLITKGLTPLVQLFFIVVLLEKK